MKNMHFKRAFLFSLCLIMLLNLLMPAVVHAEEPARTGQKVVRVGWYESSFNHTDQFGRKSGYGYEYQQRVATFTGWKYEYVEGSWSDLLAMLMAGEIDLLTDVTYTKDRAEKILYSAGSMGSEDYHVFISPGNTEIRPDDLGTFNGKRVGVNKDSIQGQLFQDWAESHGVHPELVELTVKTPENFDMLDRGDIDALVTLDTYGNSADMIPVCKIGSSDIFFGINKNRPDLKEDLDIAMNRILEDNRDYHQQLAERFNKSGSFNSFLSVEEKEWLDQHGTIRVGYRADFLPYCGLDPESHTLKGALSDFLFFAANCEKNARLSFEPMAFKTTEDALKALARGQIDCLYPISLSSYDGEKLGVIITDPFVRTEMYAVVRAADHQGISPDREMTAAVLKKHPSHEAFLKDHFPNWKIMYFDSNKENFEAVASGVVDCTLVSNYRINRVSDLCSKYNLATLATGESMDLSFATRREEDCLYSILNKVIRLIPDTRINSSLTNHGFRDDKVTFIDFLRDNLVYFIASVSLVAVIFLLLVLRNKQVEEKAAEGRQIISEAERDSLTSLYNWNFFLVYANRLCRDHPEKHMDAVVMNLDRFHSVNALHGWDFGDLVLKELGREIQSFIDGTEGIACRFVADRFDLYCLHRDDWEAQLYRFQSRIDSLFHSANIRLRMGIKPWQEGMEPVMQFDLARTACNKARNDYESRFMVYDEAMGQKEERDQRLLNDFIPALEQGQIEVYYQPKYRIQTDRPVLSSAEALVRWHHPELGLISPGDFIPLFERRGLISRLDKYVWRKAAGQIADWRDTMGMTLPVSVNLSRVDVFDPDLANILDGLVKEHGLTRKDIKLEVTESAYTDNADQLIQAVEQLRRKGYEIEMDDFGSGYSSLNMLSSMPVDILKMDIAFIRNIENNERDLRLVELVVDIARNLKVPVIAEGVETEKQLELLKAAGCDLVQGYYFSPPLPADEFEDKILKGTR